eukprot:m.407640 g.407640  ORF g.407640 m.407640 type:complete len:288 (-) comp21228_c1_seq5:433-1296(-)
MPINTHPFALLSVNACLRECVTRSRPDFRPSKNLISCWVLCCWRTVTSLRMKVVCDVKLPGHCARLSLMIPSSILQTDLKKIVDDLEFKEMSLDTEDSGTQHEMGHSVKIETYEKMYAQVMLGCKSSVPINIYQAFNTIETRVQLELLPADKDDNGAPLLHGTVTPAVFMSMIYNELYCIIASKWYFPLALPDADLVMKETFKRTREKLLQQIESASENTPGNGPTFGQLLLRRQQVLGVEAPLPGREGRSRHPEVHKGKSNVDTAGVREEPSLTRTTEADLNATTV